MSDHRRHRAHHPPPRRSDLRLMLLYVGLLVCLLLVFAGAAVTLRRVNRVELEIPDEKAAAASLLALQFVGPRYFQIPPGGLLDADGVSVLTTPEPHITLTSARSQAQGIVEERRLDARHAAKLRALLDRLAQEPSSRVVGERHVNLLRLNLALDAL